MILRIFVFMISIFLMLILRKPKKKQLKFSFFFLFTYNRMDFSPNRLLICFVRIGQTRMDNLMSKKRCKTRKTTMERPTLLKEKNIESKLNEALDA